MATKPLADPTNLTLGASAPWVRRNVGPVAWAVLEALAEHAVIDGTATMSHRSVRDIAADLHLANDTVARALRRLADHGLAQHRSDRSTTGRFVTGHYLLTLPPDVITPTPTDPPAPPTNPPTAPPTPTDPPAPPTNPPTAPPTPTATPRHQPAEHQQLDLLHQHMNEPEP